MIPLTARELPQLSTGYQLRYHLPLMMARPSRTQLCGVRASGRACLLRKTPHGLCSVGIYCAPPPCPPSPLATFLGVAPGRGDWSTSIPHPQTVARHNDHIAVLCVSLWTPCCPGCRFGGSPVPQHPQTDFSAINRYRVAEKLPWRVAAGCGYHGCLPRAVHGAVVGFAG